MAALGHDTYCTPEFKCGEGEGDCDSNNDCKSGLICGTNNCKGSQFTPGDDCCYRHRKICLVPF